MLSKKNVLEYEYESSYITQYSVAINNHTQIHPFPSESLIMALLLTQHKFINHWKSMLPTKQSDNELENG